MAALDPRPSQPSARRRTVLAVKIAIDGLLSRVIDEVVRFAAAPLLRATLGHWPTRSQLSGFRRAHKAGGHLPRLLHALSAMDEARRLITATALDAWLPKGAEGTTTAIVLIARPRAAFMHLEKTGGSSVQDFLLQQYHPIQVVTQPLDGETTTAVLWQDREARGRAFMHGHYDLPFLRAFDPERLVFTFLREPRARILSLYYYWRSSRLSIEGGEPNPAAVAAARLSLLDFLRSDMVEVRNAIDNLYARRLTGWSVIGSQDELADRNAGALQIACTALETVQFVGITEHLADSLRLLAAALQLIPPATIPRINAAADNAHTMPTYFRPVAREPMTPAIEAELTRLTHIDTALYQIACHRFDAACDLAEFSPNAAVQQA